MVRPVIIQATCRDPVVLDSRLLIFGTGQFGLRVYRACKDRGISVLGFVATTPQYDFIEDLPVYDWQMLKDKGFSANVQILCGIFNRNNPYDALSELSALHGFDHLIMPWQYVDQLGDGLGWCYWLAPVGDFRANGGLARDIEMILQLFEDDESKCCFQRILEFRSGADMAYASFVTKDPQYFNAFSLDSLLGKDGIAYLDVGAYDGDSLRNLLSCARVAKAILFEPDHSNYKSLQSTVAELQGSHVDLAVACLPIALGSSHSYASFSGAGEAACISTGQQSAETTTVCVAPFDDLFPTERVDFIKVDAEGADLDVLLGMTKAIRRSRPVMAISLYHRSADIIEIPREVGKIVAGMGYSFRLRQHMYNSFDSVLYCLPGSRG